MSAALKPKPPVPLWRWIYWSVLLAVAVVIFYGVFAVVWFSLRVVAWIAEFRARRHQKSADPANTGSSISL